MIILDHDRCSIIHDESYKTLCTLPDKHFDLIYTDPPFGKHTHAKLGAERRNDGTAPRDKLEFAPMTPDLIAKYAAQFVRLCKGWIIVHSDFRQTGCWGNEIDTWGGKWVRTGQWVKTNPMPQMTGDRPGTGAESIVIGHATGKDLAWNAHGHSDVWRGPRDAGAAHPNQKPEWLAQSILGMFAPAGGLVLDAFLGSGTTASAALRNSRCERETCLNTACHGCAKKALEEYAPPLPVGLRVIGIEGDRHWCDYSAARIEPLLRAL